MDIITVALLYGGNSIERDISFETANEIEKSLKILKYKVIKIEVNEGRDWISTLINSNIDIVVSALHGGFGENGAMQGFLDILNIPYIGSSVLGSAICMNKKISKQLLRVNHIPVANDIFIDRKREISQYEKQIEMLGYPLIVKPNSGGSSLGISIVNNFDELKRAALKIKNDDILIEKFIEGNEVTCSVIETNNGLQILTVLDIKKGNKIFDYDDKYKSNSSSDVDLSSLPAFMKTMIEKIAKKSFIALKCSGYATVDMIVFEEQVYVLEINTLPGITSNSLIPKALDKLGIKLYDYLDDLISFRFKSYIKVKEYTA